MNVLSDEPDLDLSGMTKAQLISYAESAGIEVDSTAKKAEIIEAIENNADTLQE